ncbi:UvrD-helicase domain-containing protein [Patescibacteria group bacterium]|nr:UvrD-helicase domain-containing protein [Patescibacteria group bacterium]
MLQDLNPKQKQAVTIMRGPVLVIAGPGSGKTRALTHRIAYLIQQNIPAKNILAVTFTNKAAEEMKERVKALIKPPYSLPAIGTFHSICLQILRQEIEKLPRTIYKKNFVIYDQADQLSLIKKTIKDLEINTDQFKPNIAHTTISSAKDELIDVQAYQEQAREYFPQTIAKIYQTYQSSLEKANALDFDDLIMLCVQLFQKNPAILEKYQNKWTHISVDEAHDTNHSQYTLTNLLAQKHKNLWFISDVDQSIYSWRGADFRNILNFEKDYPEAKIILLEQNYRSTKNILEASHHIIKKNTQRKEKKLWTKNPTGELINVVQSDNETEEGDFIVEEIESLIREKGLKLKDFTVLYRTNAQSRAIEEAFLKANFPYKIIGTVRFYERKEIKDILAYLKLIANPDDLVSLQRIINLPPRGIGKITFQKQAGHKIKDFYQLMDSFRNKNQQMPLTELIKSILQEIEYEKYIRNISLDTEQGERRWENTKELLTVASRYDNIKIGYGLERFLEKISLLSIHDDVETNKNLVNLMTIHCAKGLEFPVIFIAGCEEGIFPHSKSYLDPVQMEEERRLCYVGITRAKQKAYLTFTSQRKLWGQVMVNSPSRFISDIPKHLIYYKERP